MRPTNDKIIVRVNMAQKDAIRVAGVTVRTALKFENNYREKSPVVAEVVRGNAYVKEGDILLCHHNLFYPPSPFYLQDDLFAIPAGKTLFAVVDEDGNLRPVYGNLICQRVPVETYLPLPIEKQKTHIDRAIVHDGGTSAYQAGDLIFHRPHAGYDIVYVWNGVETRVTKVHDEMVCGVATK